ncbi:GNAT family N-acetyltransferase [Patulibacter minatonensis]|uniref:GNAT family N-acetyltransferase n=1 Tax=Patulibacter minatonensis TaxID=298163 RepID=UPI0004B3E752|nr:GNAT family N-acetyltransferase [Patulibacter minatonensis]
MEVRAATAEDAADIAVTRIAAWHHAYEELVDPRLLMDLDVEEETATWRRRLDGPSGPDGLRTLVAVQGHRAIGFAAVLPRRREHDLPASTAELTALYVHPTAQGAGVGSLLLPAAEDLMRGTGASGAVLRVLAGNWWARDFYAARGWSHEQGAPAVDAGGTATERWERAL